MILVYLFFFDRTLLLKGIGDFTWIYMSYLTISKTEPHLSYQNQFLYGAAVASFLRPSYEVRSKIELLEETYFYMMLLIISSSWLVGGTV